MSFSPAGIRAEEVHSELAHAWGSSYDAGATSRAVARLCDKPFHDRVMHLLARFAFRGIYFPQMKATEWARVLLDNRRTIFQVGREAHALYAQRRKAKLVESP